METCACELISSTQWLRMSDSFKWNAYCNDCGFECDAIHSVIDGYWCEIHDIDISNDGIINNK